MGTIMNPVTSSIILAGWAICLASLMPVLSPALAVEGKDCLDGIYSSYSEGPQNMTHAMFVNITIPYHTVQPYLPILPHPTIRCFHICPLQQHIKAVCLIRLSDGAVGASKKLGSKKLVQNFLNAF